MLNTWITGSKLLPEFEVETQDFGIPAEKVFNKPLSK
jgi:hypothetical protein